MDHADKSGRVPWGRILLLGCGLHGELEQRNSFNT
jgi:hypothetical protein